MLVLVLQHQRVAGEARSRAVAAHRLGVLPPSISDRSRLWDAPPAGYPVGPADPALVGCHPAVLVGPVALVDPAVLVLAGPVALAGPVVLAALVDPVGPADPVGLADPVAPPDFVDSAGPVVYPFPVGR